MWQAVVASWLMVMTSGQLELNAPLNAAIEVQNKNDARPTNGRPVNQGKPHEQNDIVNLKTNKPPETIVQPAWKPVADDPAEQAAEDAASTADHSRPAASPMRQPVINTPRPPREIPPPTPNDAPDANAVTSPALPKPILTRQTYFSIPARSEETQSKSTIVEVQLFVSTDRGANWNFYSRVKPDQPRIPFRTANDGEYWFATRTLDRSGRFQPQTVTAPAVIAIIDTKPPVVLLSAESASGGQVTARWEITDPHLKPDSLTLQYRSSNNAPWQPVAIGENDVTSTETTLSGEVTWWPTPGTPEVILRAEVTDAAGNKAVGHAQAKLGASGNPMGGAAKSTSTRPLAEGAGVRAVTAATNPKIGNKFQPGTNSALMNNPYYAYLPPSEKPRMVNSRVFELDYDLQSVGPSGVSRVELFGTRDGGKTWRSFGIDSDNRSPMTVQTDEEGLFGFQIVVTSGAGLGDPAPKSGDKPSIWIGVDLTRPVAKITSAEFGNDENEDKLVISWEAYDKMIAEKPVTLSYSAQPSGQFTPFASNLENTGSYAWMIDSTIPPLIYLRLEVVDEAGNRTFCDTPQPIPLDRSRPSGRILNVRAAGR